MHIPALKDKQEVMRGIIILLLAALFAGGTLVQAAITRSEYSVSEEKIVDVLPLRGYSERIIYLTNRRTSAINVYVAVTGEVMDLVKVDKSHITIGPSSIANITLTLYGLGNGTKSGFLELTSGVEEKLPVNITVSLTDAVPIEALLIEIEPEKTRIEPGKNFMFRVNLQNLLTDRKLNISINYVTSYANGSKTSLAAGTIKGDSLVLNTSRTLLRNFTLLSNASTGIYVISAEANYLGLSLVASTHFEIFHSPLEYPVFRSIRTKHLIMAGATILFLLFGYRVYRKKKAAKQKYKSKIDYGKLPKPGPRAGYIGKIAETNVNAYFDLDQLMSHALVAGSTGGGKTVSAKVLIEEALLKGAAVFVFDPTAQWSGLLRKCSSKKMFDLYARFGMKPTDARAFNGNVIQILNAREVIDAKKYVKPGEVYIFSINRLDPEDIDIVVSNTIRGIFNAGLPESSTLKLLIVFDEVHRLLPKFGGSGEGFIQVERGMREFRKWGVGMLLISQVLTDFVGETKANIATELQLRTRDQGDLDRIKNKYGSYMLQSLLKASTGTGMVENPEYNNGEPYFVSFRPLLHEHARLSDEELENYNKYNAIIDDLEYQIEQLEKEGLDSFDMKLELKMALDKVKSGAFNMANIYIEGLSPRIKDQWKKLGKEPKKREIKLVSEDDLKRELEKAKQARDKWEAQQGGAKQKEPEGPPPLRLKNGIVVMTKEELNDALQSMEDDVFAQHVTGQINLLYDWLNKFDKKAAENVKPAKTRAEFITALNKKEEVKDKKKK